jgi:hypothetical protein
MRARWSMHTYCRNDFALSKITVARTQFLPDSGLRDIPSIIVAEGSQGFLHEPG